MNTSVYQLRFISSNSDIIVANLLISGISRSNAAHGMACATCMSWCSCWREIVRRKPITLNSSSGYTAVISRLAGAHTHAASATRITHCMQLSGWHDKVDCNCCISIPILDCYYRIISWNFRGDMGWGVPLALLTYGWNWEGYPRNFLILYSLNICILLRYKWNSTYSLLIKTQQFDKSQFYIIVIQIAMHYLWGAITKETRMIQNNGARKNYKQLQVNQLKWDQSILHPHGRRQPVCPYMYTYSDAREWPDHSVFC